MKRRIIMNRAIIINDTNFIYDRNLAGDPSKSGKYHSTTRYVNIMIPTKEQADDMANSGINVKETKPREGEEEDFIPTYFVKAIANYEGKSSPKIYLVAGDKEPVLLNPNSVSEIDGSYVTKVRAALNPWYSEQNDTTSCYIQTMYVEIEDTDPFDSYYTHAIPDSELERPL